MTTERPRPYATTSAAERFRVLAKGHTAEGRGSLVKAPPVSPAEQRLEGVLRFLGIALLGSALLYELGPLLGPFKVYFRHLPFVANSVVKVTLLGMVALYASGNLRRRRTLVELFLIAHMISVGFMLLLLALRAPYALAARNVLWGAVALDGCLVALVGALYVPLRARLRAEDRREEQGDLEPAERRLRFVLGVLGVVSVVFAVGYELGPLLPGGRELFREIPFVTNSAVRATTIALLCFYVARNLRANLPVLGIVIVGQVISALASAVLLLPQEAAELVTAGGVHAHYWDLLGGGAALDLLIGIILLALNQAAWNARLRPEFLHQMEYRSLIAMTEVLLRDRDSLIPPLEVARKVDRYVCRIRARRRWVYRAALFGIQLHPVLYLKAPFSELSEEQRLKHLKRHFYRAVVLRLVPDWWRRFVQIAIRIGKQLVYIGYYGDRRVYPSIGFERFVDRERTRGMDLPRPEPHPLVVESARTLREYVLDADVCIIGSGAAGSMLAHELVRRGRDVLLLERGQYVEPREFTDDEVEMIGRLYADGVFQQTEDFRFTILQGSCIGGSTTVNNAVCFDPPDSVLEEWNDRSGLNAGLDLARLRQSLESVSKLISIQTQAKAPLNPSADRFTEGARHVSIPAAQLQVGVVRANIHDCLGCGYCNIGCAYGRKLSMLQTILPKAQQLAGSRLRIVSECEVVRLRALSGTPQRIIDARCALPNGRRATIRANTFLVASGAIASSHLLLRSGIGRGLPVGERLSFNMGSPLTAEFDRPLRAYDGLQISHYGIPHPSRGFILETWWNPPASQAVNLPGWFEDHFDNMQKYDRMMAVGVLVGTAPTGRVRRAFTGGPGVDFVPDPADLRKLADGLSEVGEMLFSAGARRLMVNTWGYDSFTHPNQLPELYRIASDPSYITLGTGHPQGGNAVGVDPRRGVVGPDFRVHGYANLYVCDASVFPTSLTVNPQLTVMGLAHYAAAGINGR